MLNETFIFKGKRAKNKGIELQDSITLSAAVPIFSEYNIPGRNGTLYQYNGTYENRSIIVPCFLLSYLLEKDIDSINSWLLSDPGYHRFEDTNDEKHFMLARAKQGVNKSARAHLLNSFVLEFDTKPQRFLKSGEKTLDVTERKNIYNPTQFPALPLIEVQGSGDITITINGVALKIYDLNGTITYDAESDDAYNGENNLNNKVGVSDQMTIPSGSNSISVSGSVTSIKITPRWWEL